MTDYYRFEQEKVLNLIAAPGANVVYDKSEKLAVASGLESVYLWNTRIGSLFQSWSEADVKVEVSLISRSPVEPTLFAVGYADGSVRLWNQTSKECKVTFQGHKSAVTTIAWDHTGSKLATGSKDCDIILWDCLSEAGVCRLRGHTNGITQVAFVKNSTALISSSKDTLVKLWDLSTQHCLETIVTHRAEVTAFAFHPEHFTLITFGADQHIRLFKADLDNISKIINPGENTTAPVVFEPLETVDRTGKDRVLCIGEHGEYLCILSSDKSVEVFRVNYKSEARKTKGTKKSLSSVHCSRFPEKPLALDISANWSQDKHKSIKMVLLFNNNSIQEWAVPLNKESEKEKLHGVEFTGHRTDIKSITLSYDEKMMASVSGEGVKVWNVESGVCIRNFELEEGITCAFVPGDKYLMVSNRMGAVNVLELVSGNLLMAIEAHSGPVWSIQVAPDAKGFITGGADKTVKFWEFKKDKKDAGVLAKIKHIKTLQLSDEVLAAKYSPDMRLLAVSLMDMTVKVFFEDSLKLSLSLYGHKLPVTSMDISQDGSTIVTASSDKNVKIWSLQFGDCRKSIFAHQEAITWVSFLGNSNEFVTASKDKTIRYWDAKKFTALQKLTGHHSEVWAACANRSGDMVITAANDKTIRVWRKTDELLFPEEEQEKEMEETMDASLLAANPHEGGEQDGAIATKATVSAMKAGERIVEAIQVADIETQKARDQKLARENGIELELQAPEPLMLAVGRNKTPAELVLWAVGQVPLAELEEALLTLPSTLIPSLLQYVTEWFSNRLNLVVACRVLNLMLKVHYNQIIGNGKLRAPLEALRAIQQRELKDFKDVVGCNIAMMRTIKQ